MTLPLIVLAILSIVGGFIGIPEVLGGHHALHAFLSSVLIQTVGSQAMVPHLSHQNELLLMGVAVLIATIGIVIAWFGYKKYNQADEAKGIASFFEQKWYIDEFYQAIIIKPLYAFSAFAERFIEKSGIDGIVNGVGRLIQFGSTRLRLLQSGLVGLYLFLIVIGIVMMFVIQLVYNKF
jgi:NADH-quinone oxidoreductase subunit L